MDKTADRRRGFKTPPIEARRSQEARRAEALQEQKRKRAQQVDAARQLDQFAGLSLGVSSDEDEGEEQDGLDVPKRTLDNSPHHASLLLGTDAEIPPDSRSPSPYPEENTVTAKSKRRRRKKGKKKANEWANKCMYAELLEMREDTLYTDSWDIGGAPQHDGLPDDLETAWVGLGPLPVGKRCLAVTMQGAGANWKVSNTTLRSRLMGKVLIHLFPSPLPPNTILDCILDENWRANGILHVLDVIRWKSQDVGGCEASFRFWWRDTRLSEIRSFPHPAPHKSSFESSETSAQPTYRFPYPTTLTPVPYIKPNSLNSILSDLIPRARNGQTFHLKLPILHDLHVANGEEMQVDFLSGQEEGTGSWPGPQTKDTDITIRSDGLLLYVGEASYESGESPLSVWLPCEPTERHGYDRIGGTSNPVTKIESPLDMFERYVSVSASWKDVIRINLRSSDRLVRRRLILRQGGHTMAAAANNTSVVVEVNME